MAAYSGFEEKDYDSIFITLDKMDKIGTEGVSAELLENGYAKESVDKYLGLFEALTDKKRYRRACLLQETLGTYLDEEISTNLQEIAQTVEAAKAADFALVFDPTLVRGMSYYTGTILKLPFLNLAEVVVAVRYDEMIGKFTGQNVPACGFSIDLNVSFYF